MIPAVGKEITVTVSNPLVASAHLYAKGVVPKTLTFTGTVFPTQKWQDAHKVFNLSTGQKQFQFREIELGSVIAVDGVAQKIKVDPPKTRVWVVKGSKGNDYTVTETAGRRTCTCTGFGFRRTCRHIVGN